jgi:hypothetical protein
VQITPYTLKKAPHSNGSQQEQLASCKAACKLAHCLLLACRNEMKLGVLVNEVASLDVDSQLLNAQQSNAAAGIKAVRLAGGCACCAVAGNLEAALAELASSPSYQHLDYLVSWCVYTNSAVELL